MSKDKYSLPIINTLELFPIVNKSLIELLKSLNSSQWNKETVIPNRSVKDIASHILHGSLRRLSLCRDVYQADKPNINSYDELTNYIQIQNKTWIEASKFISPKLLISLLEIYEQELYHYLSTLKNTDRAKLAVAWAGQSESENWFDIAREYTEKWHHQMQIRLAVNKPGIDSPKLFYPALDTFMRGLPYVYQQIKAEIGSGIEITITGAGGGQWYLEKTFKEWLLTKELSSKPLTKIEISDSIAWRIFTDSINFNVAKEKASIVGDEELGKQFFKLKAVMR
jgi:hypothetical protein